MKRTISCFLSAVAFFLCIVTSSQATKWADEKIVCPLCKTKNKFKEIVSYGSYIYHWPSKFQYVFWPFTASPVLYSCKKCSLTMFMDDFSEIPDAKITQVRKALGSLKIKGKYSEYTRIPMSERLAIAEKVYLALGRDDKFWCHFYRVAGYHLGEEKNDKEAAEARKKALNLSEKMLGDDRHSGVRKELLLISGAMSHFLGNDEGAIRAFKKAQELKFANPCMEKDQNEEYDTYLSGLLAEYIQSIETIQKPE